MSDLVPVRRALLSVSDKTGLVPFATALVNEFGVELISTGGTAQALRDAGLAVKDVSEVTGFPEMMDGRVKTLHPAIHGGLLALRDDDEHVAAMQRHGIVPIDLVVVNLYPFPETVAKPGVSFEEAIENIDIGGPSMIRSAAKNHRSVLVVTSPDRYEKVLGDLRKHAGSSCAKHRLKMAERAFNETWSYDFAISGYLRSQLGAAPPIDPDDIWHDLGTDSLGKPQVTLPMLRLRQQLRYGENPHQRAALYVPDEAQDGKLPSLATATQLHGKDLSYINLLDVDAALACVREFDAMNRPAACVVKHATPCGVAVGDDLADAFAKAYAGDPVAAFGGIVAVNRPIDLAAARAIVDGQKFLEVVVAPAYDDDNALALLKERWKNVRLLATRNMSVPLISSAGDELAPAKNERDADVTQISIRSIDGGYLVQESDDVGIVESEWKVVSNRPPTESEIADLRFAWLACKHVKSNAIVIARGGATVGIGGGQVDRVGAARVAIEKAGDLASGAVAASDAFFPFPDGPELLLRAGVTAIVQPGGSTRDSLTIDAVNAADASMIFTGRRHFRH